MIKFKFKFGFAALADIDHKINDMHDNNILHFSLTTSSNL